MSKLGEVQYSTGIPRFVYPVSLGEAQYPVSLGQGGFGQVAGAFQGIAQISLGFFKEYNNKSLTKKKLKYEAKLNELEANLQHLTEKEQIAAQVEMRNIQAQLDQAISEIEGEYGLQTTQVLALAGVAAVGLLGLFFAISRVL